MCFMSVASKTSDLILMVLDATKRVQQRALLEAELEAVGIRLNREPPYGCRFICFRVFSKAGLLETSISRQRKLEG